MCDCVCLACFGACAAAIFIIGIYFFFGIFFTTMAIRAKTAINSYDVILMHSSDKLSQGNVYLNLCITIGVLFTFLTILGWAGEKKGKKTRLVYAAAQFLIVILGIILYIFLYPNKTAVENFIFKGLNNSLHVYGENMSAKANVTAEWDRVQSYFECCGIRNYLDWEEVTLTTKTPISCCRQDHRMRGCSDVVTFKNPYESNKIIYVQGCFDSVRSGTLGQVEFLDYFLITIWFVTCLGCLITCCSSGVKKDDEGLEVKKVGPIIVRRRTTKRKGDTSEKDVENPEPEESGKALALTEHGEGDDDLKKGSGLATVVETV